MIQKERAWTAAAVDLGAASGRVITGRFDGEKLSLNETHRFENEPEQVLQTLHWDILRLYHEIKQGIRKAARAAKDAGEPLASIGIDSWGVDFGLLDRAGNLLGNPVHYRDHRNDGVMEKVFQRIPRAEIFRNSGIQFLPFNTIYQLAAMQQAAHPQLAQADAMLMIPDLLAYFLTGVKAAEFTNSTTTQLVDPHTGQWSSRLISGLGLPQQIFRPIIQPGTRLGELLPAVADELGGVDVPVVAVATHDTGSAVAGTPASSEYFAYLSCGTWSLLGTEIKAPALSERALALNFTNEGGVCGTYRLLKNIMGLWLLQELKREWERAGRGTTWPEMMRLTETAPAFAAFIDPEDGRFLAPGAMSPRVRDFCKQTGQAVPESDAALLRCVTESLALKYRWALERLEELTGQPLPALHMVGGGIQNTLLCQWTADACARPVLSGPVEATALGNLAVQLMAAGEVASIGQARDLIRRSFTIRTYEPRNTAAWSEVCARFGALLPAN